jgi:hypothetical protein
VVYYEAGAGCAAGATVVMMPSSGQSGNFNTGGAVCVQMQGSVVMNWGVSNGDGRMVSVTSAAGTAGPVVAVGAPPPGLPGTPQAGADGFVYWNFTAGSPTWTSMYVY